MTIASGIASLVTATVALLALVGGYVRFVIRPATLPSVEFDVDLTMSHRGQTQLICEPALVVRNVGANTVILTNLRFKLRYRLSTDAELLWQDGLQPVFAHKQPEYQFFATDTFVQPAVTQHYRHPVALPAETRAVDLVGLLDYKITVGWLTRFLIGLSSPGTKPWRDGVLDHTTRRVFALPGDDA